MEHARGLNRVVATLGMLAACADEAPVLGESSTAITGSISISTCSVPQSTILTNAVGLGRAIVESHEFRACARAIPYLKCDGFLQADPDGGIESALWISHSPNELDLTCTELDDGKAGQNVGEDDLGFTGVEEILFDSAVLDTNIAVTPRLGITSVAGTLIHEITHEHGFDHGEHVGDDGGAEDCGYEIGDYHGRQNSIPYRFGQCMGEVAQMLVGIEWARAFGTSPTDADLAPYYTTNFGTLNEMVDEVRQDIRGITRTLVTGPSAFATSTGGASAVGEFGGTASPDLVVVSMQDEDASPLHWRIQFCTDLSPAGCTWAASQAVPDDGTLLGSPSVGIGDFDGDGTKDDLMITAIDHWSENPDYWRIKIGVNCTVAAGCAWGPTVGVDTGGSTVTGGGIAVGDLDGNTIPDVIVSTVDSWDDGDDYLRYRVGLNCNYLALDFCTWLTVGSVPVTAPVLSGGGIAMQSRRGPTGTLVAITAVSAGTLAQTIESYNSYDAFVYVLGTCTTAGTCTFAPAQRIQTDAQILKTGNVFLGHFASGDPRAQGTELLLVAADLAPGNMRWISIGGNRCSAATGTCVLGPSRVVSAHHSSMLEATAQLYKVPGEAQENLVFVGVEGNAEADDFFRLLSVGFPSVHALAHWYFGEWGLEPNDPGSPVSPLPVPFDANPIAMFDPPATSYDYRFTLASATDVDVYEFRIVAPTTVQIVLKEGATFTGGRLDAGFALATSTGSPIVTVVGDPDDFTESSWQLLQPGLYTLTVTGNAGSAGWYGLRLDV